MSKWSSLLYFLVMVAVDLSSYFSEAALGWVQIMPLGDSITVGYPVPGGYRVPLAVLLNNLGCNFSLTGSVTGDFSFTGRTHDTTLHEGHGGYTISMITSNLDADGGTSGNNGGFWLTGISGTRDAVASNVIILLDIGTNNIWVNNRTPQTMANDLNTLISKVFTLRPNCVLLVSNLAIYTNELIDGFNSLVPSVVQTYANAGRKCYFVDMHSALTPEDLYDSVHPNASGYQKMANGWFSVLQINNLVPANNYTTHKYYVSNSGLDSNPGTSEAFPWATLDKVNHTIFYPGDLVCFKRGDVWRGSLVPYWGGMGNPVTYTAYGSGNKPLFLGSIEWNDSTRWINLSGNTWSASYSPSAIGSELLSNPSFDSNSTYWGVYYANGAMVSMSRTTSDYDSSPAGLQLACTAPGTAQVDIQLSTSPVSITKGTFYRLTFRAKCGGVDSITFPVTLMKGSSPWTDYALTSSYSTKTVGTAWATYTIYYEAGVTATDARFTFYLGGAMVSGSTLSLDTLSFKKLDGPVMTTDIGNIIFNNSTCGVKKWSPSALSRQGEFWYDGDTARVLLYSSSNPTLYYSDIELATSRGGIPVSNRSFITLDNLALAYNGANGIRLTNASYVTITNCDMSYMGGGEQGGFGSSNHVRFGNGVECWESVNNITVENCHIRQVYDAAITNQGFGVNQQYNLYYRYNTIENCEYGYELWNASSNSTMGNICFEHNTCLNAGSWGHVQRPDPYGTFLQLSTSAAAVPATISITNNTFDTALRAAINLNLPWTDLNNVIINNNTYRQPDDAPLVQWGGTWYNANPSGFTQYQIDTGKDANSTLMAGTESSFIQNGSFGGPWKSYWSFSGSDVDLVNWMGNLAPCAVYYGSDPYISQVISSNTLGPNTRYQISIDAMDRSNPSGSCGLYVYMGYYNTNDTLIGSDDIIMVNGPNLPTTWTNYSSYIYVTPSSSNFAYSVLVIRKRTASAGWLVVDNVRGIVVPPVIPGDANKDWMVDVGDLGILAANYGMTVGATWSQGDFNGDGEVDVGDLGILATHYGEGTSHLSAFDADSAKIFGGTVAKEDTSTGENNSNSVCNVLGLPLITGFMLMGLMLMKSEK